MFPKVCVVVLAWNHYTDTFECLVSLLKSDYPSVRFVLVDNASSDGTAQAAAQDFPNVHVIEAPTNFGIAGGYNLGIEHSLKQGADYVLVTNNDLIVDEGMVRHLVAGLVSHPNSGLAMPKIHHYYGDRTRLWCPGAYWRPFPPAVKMIQDVADGPQYSILRTIEFVPSCCLMIKRATIEQAGLFDTGYFFYYDDWDYSLRVRQAGFTLLFVPDAKLWHKVSVSTQKSEQPSRWWRIMGHSTVRFYLRHTNLVTLAMFSIWFGIRELISGKSSRVLPFFAGVFHALRGRVVPMHHRSR